MNTGMNMDISQVTICKNIFLKIWYEENYCVKKS